MEANQIPTLETERLRLRAFRRSDLDSYAALHADPEVMRYMGCGPQPWDLGRSTRHLAFLVGHWHLEGSGVWALEHRETGVFVGMVGLTEPGAFVGLVATVEPGSWAGCELSWKLVRRWWGNGFATEGARAALAYAFDSLGKDHVISLINPENHASIRVAERLGERLEGRTQLYGREMLRYGTHHQTPSSPSPYT